jgi:hypothetical protein
MPAGGGGAQDYYTLQALTQMLEKAGIKLSSQELYSIYIDLKAGYQNADREVLTIGEDGKPTLSQDFIKDIYSWAKTGQNPYGVQAPGPSTYNQGTQTGDFVFGKGDGTSAADKKAARLSAFNSKKDYAASYRATLAEWQIPIDESLTKLVDEASANGYSSDRFLNALRQTDQYAERFAGIFGDKGTLKFSEAEYLSREAQYQDIAAQSGVDIGDRKELYLFENNVSPAEFQTKATALRQLKDNPALFDQFASELVKQGVAKKSDISKKALFDTIMGEGNAEWYHVWNMSVARYAATEAGIQIGQGHGLYGALPRQLIKAVANKGFDQGTLDQGFAQVAEQFLTVLPASKIQGYGLTKKQILAATFGGKGSAEVKQKIAHIMEQEQAFFDTPRGTMQVQGKVSGGLQQQGSGAADKYATE